MAQLIVRHDPYVGLTGQVNEHGKEVGMIQDVLADGINPGTKVVWPQNIVVHLPVSVSRLRRYMAQELEDDTDDPVFARTLALKGVRIKRAKRYRQWHLEVDGLSKSVLRAASRNSGRITVGPGGDMTWSAFRALLRNKKTGLVETAPL